MRPQRGYPPRDPTHSLPGRGRVWIKSGRYWIAYQTDPVPVIVAVYFETANIPGRL